MGVLYEEESWWKYRYAARNNSLCDKYCRQCFFTRIQKNRFSWNSLRDSKMDPMITASWERVFTNVTSTQDAGIRDLESIWRILYSGKVKLIDYIIQWEKVDISLVCGQWTHSWFCIQGLVTKKADFFLGLEVEKTIHKLKIHHFLSANKFCNI